jgi:tRNA threonylcarbamoyl adenosine modification protein YeaZ
MLQATGGTPADIAAIVVGVGPGTFTGVRIAVATARALALALSVPVVGVGTLGALAAQAASPGREGRGERPHLIVPVVDARRGQVFYAVYRRAEHEWPAGARSTEDGGAAGVGNAGHGETSGAAEESPYARTEGISVCDRSELFDRLAGLAGESIAGGPLQPRVPVAGGLSPQPRVLIAGDVEGLGGPVGQERSGVARLSLEVRAEHLVMGQGLLREPEEADDTTAGRRLHGWLAQVLSTGRADACGDVPLPYRAGEPGSPEAVKPIYVRSPDADIHITRMKDPWAGSHAER